MPVSINGGPPIACRWFVEGDELDPVEWRVEVRGTSADLAPLLSMEAVRVRVDTPLGVLRGRARMTRLVIDVTRLPDGAAVLTGQGALRVTPPPEEDP